MLAGALMKWPRTHLDWVREAEARGTIATKAKRRRRRTELLAILISFVRSFVREKGGKKGGKKVVGF